MAMTAFDAAALTTNAGRIGSLLAHEHCPILIVGDSYCNVGGTAPVQNHGFLPRVIKELCTDEGVDCLGIEVRAVGSLNVYGDENGIKSALSGSTPGEANP